MVRAALNGRPGQRYILGGEYHSLAAILHTLERITGIPAPRIRFPYAPALGFAFLSQGWTRLSGKPAMMTPAGLRTIRAKVNLDSGKARRELGVSFRSLEETLTDTVAWYRQNGYD
jgi:dihydroflavonol-4-reductase